MGNNIKLFGSSGSDKSENKRKKTVGQDTASFEAVNVPEPSEEQSAVTDAPAPGPAKPEPKKPAPKPVKKNSAARTALITLAVVMAVLLAAAAGLGVYVNSTDTIFPRVSLFGVSVGGMTEEQARTKFVALGWDEIDGEVTVLLPLGRRLTVKAADAGADVSSAEAAAAAYRCCHGGSVLDNTVVWIKSVLAGTEINVVPSLDESLVRQAVEKEVTELTEGLMSSGMEITDDAVLVVKGASSVTVDNDQLCTLITDALRTRSYGEIEYEIEVGEAEPLDIDELYDSVFAEPADAYYDAEKGEVAEAVVGRDFDKNEAKRLWDAADYGDTVMIPLDITEPELTTEALKEMLFRDELSTWTTSLAGSTGDRITNIELACSIINGTVLEPGDVFSYNGALGERTKERGFRPAGAYSGGQVVQETGGGICQVSSTIYYCSLLANLETVDRSCHYFPVGYLPPGLDATVSWKLPDFKFKNNRDFPIRIEAKADREKNTMSVTFIGTDVDGSYVQMTYASWSVFNNPDYPEVATGYKAATYRNIYDKDGNLLSHELEAYSEYHYHEEDLDFPETPSPSPSAPAVTDAPPEPTTPATVPPEITPTPEITTPVA